MPAVSYEEMKEIWNHTTGYSWSSLRFAVEELAEAEVLDDLTVRRLHIATNELERRGLTFPQYLDDLYTILDETLT